MNPQAFELSLEQSFQLRQIQDGAATMDREHAIGLLLETTRLLMVKDNMIRHLMKKEFEGIKGGDR